MSEPGILNGWLSFSSEHRHGYGARFTILSPPSDAPQDEMTISSGVEGAQETVRLLNKNLTDAGVRRGAVFVVLRCSTAGGNLFRHEAVPASELERASEEIEAYTHQLLRQQTPK